MWNNDDWLVAFYLGEREIVGEMLEGESMTDNEADVCDCYDCQQRAKNAQRNAEKMDADKQRMTQCDVSTDC